MRVMRVLIVGVVLAVIAILSGIVQDVQDAQAIPAFARKYDFACNVCHVPGFPKLNDFGNVFRDQGYQLGTDGDLPTFEALGKGFWPVSLRTTVGYQVANIRVDGQPLTTSGFGFTGLDVLSFGTLARNLSFGIVYTPGLVDAGFGTGSSVQTDSNLESAFVRVLNLERFVGGASNTYLMNLKVGKFEPDLPFSEKRAPTLNTVYVMYHYTPRTPYAATIGFPTVPPATSSPLNGFGNANPFALGDNQPGIELTGIKRTDVTGGYFRYSLAGLTTNGGSFGDVSGRSTYFYGHVTQSFGGYGIVAGQRNRALVLARNGPTQSPASLIGTCGGTGALTQGEPFRRVGVDVSLTYGGQWNLFG